MFRRWQRKGPPDYGAATQVHPEWTVGYMVFRSGIPLSPMTSAAGGGSWTPRNWQGPQQPVVVTHVSAITSVAGSGSLPIRPYFAAPLAGGDVGSGA